MYRIWQLIQYSSQFESITASHESYMKVQSEVRTNIGFCSPVWTKQLNRDKMTSQATIQIVSETGELMQLTQRVKALHKRSVVAMKRRFASAIPATEQLLPLPCSAGCAHMELFFLNFVEYGCSYISVPSASRAANSG